MGRSNRLGQSEQFLRFVAFPCCIAALVQGECALAQGGLHMCRGALCGVVALVWWFALFA
jgi:hypothetical protein